MADIPPPRSEHISGLVPRYPLTLFAAGQRTGNGGTLPLSLLQPEGGMMLKIAQWAKAARWSFDIGVEWLDKSGRYDNEPCHYHWQNNCWATLTHENAPT